MTAKDKRVVVFFDFDGTLAKGDSLWPFLLAARGPLRCFWAGACALLIAVFAPPGVDRRTIIKEKLLQKTLGGIAPSALAPAIERMKTWPRWIEGSVAALRQHHEAGHVVVIATGSLGLYMRPMLKAFLPYHDLLCTEIDEEGGVLTGNMPLGNCVRARKAERVASYIAENGPFADSWAYGNAPHDLPMMELVKNRVVV